MAISAVPKNFRDGSLVFSDATGSPITLTIQYEPGDFTLSPLGQGTKNYEISNHLDRGDWYAARKTNQKFPTFSLTCHATDFSDATEKTVPDLVRKLGAFSAGVSGYGANADVWAIDLLTLTEEGTNYGDLADHTIVMNDLQCEVEYAQGDPNTFTITGIITGAITMT